MSKNNNRAGERTKECIHRRLVQGKGVLTTSEALEEGISKPTFLRYVKESGLVKLAHGIYGEKEISWESDGENVLSFLSLLQLQYPKLIFSHETALFLHGILTEFPQGQEISISMGRGYHAHSMEAHGLRVYRLGPDKISLGLVTRDGALGRPLRLYDVERTICDLIRSRNRLDTGSLAKAIRFYGTFFEKDYTRLMEYAKILRVTKTLVSYMELLL